jgi:hypothetical protein
VTTSTRPEPAIDTQPHALERTEPALLDEERKPRVNVLAAGAAQGCGPLWTNQARTSAPIGPRSVEIMRGAIVNRTASFSYSGHAPERGL